MTSDDRRRVLLFHQEVDGRSLRSWATGVAGGGVHVLTEDRRDDDVTRTWGHAYDRAQAAEISALLGGGPGEPALDLLEELAGAGELPADQTLDGWLADHGVAGTPLDPDDL